MDVGIGILDKSCLASLLTTPERHQPRGHCLEIGTLFSKDLKARKADQILARNVLIQTLFVRTYHFK